jgi:hypothetical protein
VENTQSDKSDNVKDETLDRENMPRFSLAELRQVLNEKNDLKARLLQAEEELADLRPKLRAQQQKEYVWARAPCPHLYREEELVVYGPMPREPDEKLYPWKYKRQQSGVRKL